MFVNDEIPQSRAKMGWYEVNGSRYVNKYHALKNCPNGEWPTWNFNDKAYSSIDWSIEPESDLYSLYKARAEQLRNKYQYLVLYYSGGIDSHTILRTFLDNNILLDAIVVSGSYSADQENKWLCNQEQKNVAIKNLELLKKQNKLNCKIIYLDTVQHHHFEDENWVYACGTSLSPQVYSYNHFWKDAELQQFILKGKTAFIRGIDKPRLICQQGTWYGSFLDNLVVDGTPTGNLSANQDWDIQEYFYWTPDMPQLVVKQCHVMIQYLEQNLTKSEIETLTTKDCSFNRTKYNQYADPLCYGRYLDQLPGQERSYFTLDKPFTPNAWGKDIWFFQTKDSHIQEYNKWIAGLSQLAESIPQNRFNSQPDGQQIEKFAKNYGLDSQALDLGPVLFGSVGIWSKFYPIKKLESKQWHT